MLFAWQDRLPDATLTASTETNTQPVQNLQAPTLDLLWRTDSASGEYVDIDLGSSLAWQVLVLRGNFTSSTNIRIRASDTDTTTGDELDTGTVSAGVDDNYGDIYYVASSEVTARYLRVNLDDSGLSRFDVMAGFLAPIKRPTWDVIADWAVTPIDFGRRQSMTAGHIHTEIGAKSHALEFTLNMTEAEASTIARALARHSGTTKNALAMIEETGDYVSELSALGLVSGLNAVRSPGAFGLRRSRWQIAHRVKPV